MVPERGRRLLVGVLVDRAVVVGVLRPCCTPPVDAGPGPPGVGVAVELGRDLAAVQVRDERDRATGPRERRAGRAGRGRAPLCRGCGRTPAPRPFGSAQWRVGSTGKMVRPGDVVRPGHEARDAARRDEGRAGAVVAVRGLLPGDGVGHVAAVGPDPGRREARREDLLLDLGHGDVVGVRLAVAVGVVDDLGLVDLQGVEVVDVLRDRRSGRAGRGPRGRAPGSRCPSSSA